MNSERLPFALTAYGLPHRMGYLAVKSGEKHREPFTALNLMNLAEENGLEGVEFPLSALVPSFDGAKVQVGEAEFDVVAELRRRGLRLVADYGAILDNDAKHLTDYLIQAKEAGAAVVRATLSHILCGDRRRLPGGWEAHLSALAARLNEVLPAAEGLGICIAVENHQDATTEDLLRLAEMVKHSPAFGITLDAGNPLAVGQEPVEAAQKLAPLIRHIHLKDYTIHFAPEGFRLVRCAAGDGVVDFPAILEIVHKNGYEVLPGIEIAAQATRTVPLLEPSWWDCYPPRQAKELAAALRILWEKGRPCEEPYASAWERGEDSETVSADELDVVQRSIAYFREIQITRLAAEETGG